jgi:hypothetical protein
MDVFKYDKKQSYEANYHRWRMMNIDERHKENLTVYSAKESKVVFDGQWKKYKYNITYPFK